VQQIERFLFDFLTVLSDGLAETRYNGDGVTKDVCRQLQRLAIGTSHEKLSYAAFGLRRL